MCQKCEFLLLKLSVKFLRWYQDLFLCFATSISQDQKKNPNTLVVYLFKFPGEKLPKVREVSAGGNVRVGDSENVP